MKLHTNKQTNGCGVGTKMCTMYCYTCGKTANWKKRGECGNKTVCKNLVPFLHVWSIFGLSQRPFRFWFMQRHLGISRPVVMRKWGNEWSWNRCRADSNVLTTLLEMLLLRLLLLLFRCRIVRNVVFIRVHQNCGRIFFSQIHRLIGKFNNSYFFTKIIKSHHENCGALFSCMQSILSFPISNKFGSLNRIVSIFFSLIWKIYTIDTSQWWNKINEFVKCRPNKMRTALNSLQFTFIGAMEIST